MVEDDAGGGGVVGWWWWQLNQREDWKAAREQSDDSRGGARAARATFVPQPKTRECNHVVQCAARELELLAGTPGCFVVDSDKFSRL